MDFIKKHFEKLLLAGALILLIGVAGFLAYRVSGLSDEIQAAPNRPQPKGKSLPGTPTSDYTNAIAGLQSPSLWHTNTVDPFDTHPRWTSPAPTNIVVHITGPSVELQRVIRQRFKLIFLSYKEPGADFGINFIARNRTFFVKKVGLEIADGFEKTGYVITKFEHKTTDVFNRTLNVTNKVDISELTIERKGDQPILLVLGKTAEEHEPIAIIACQTDNQSLQLRKGDEFPCDGKTYKVIDIAPTQVIIEDTQSKEKTTISLPGDKE